MKDLIDDFKNEIVKILVDADQNNIECLRERLSQGWKFSIMPHRGCPVFITMRFLDFNFIEFFIPINYNHIHFDFKPEEKDLVWYKILEIIGLTPYKLDRFLQMV